MLQDLSGTREAETEQDWPLLCLSPGLFSATEAVIALLSSDNRWANGFCHPMLACLHAAGHRHLQKASAANSRLADYVIYLKQYLLSNDSAI